MRRALDLLDFGDASIGDLQRLLLRAAFAPAFLRAAEGRRFIAHLFTLDVRKSPFPRSVLSLHLPCRHMRAGLGHDSCAGMN
jgi:hypothetical protein